MATPAGRRAGRGSTAGPAPGWAVRLAPVHVPTEIDCVDCGGTCHLISYERAEPFEPGDIVAYRCRDCLDRWDIELGDEDAAGHVP